MMDRTEKKILEIIDQNRDRILEFGRDVYKHAELGYMEERTSGVFLKMMQKLGLSTNKNLALTGVKAYLHTGNSGPVLALLGEMDGLPMPDHPYANPETGAAHACGHHCQLTGVAGAAVALTDPEVMAALCGDVVFFAVPAEEVTNQEYKEQLIREGKIAYRSGKSELIRTGAFDGIDLCISHHSANEISFGGSSANGVLAKTVRYYGKSAHAAVAPESGVNALSAANLALQAIGMNREGFAEKDKIRINTVLTEGGTAPGMIPEKAKIEALIRGKNIEAMEKASKVADRCFRSGAIAMGAGIKIETSVGYLPEKSTRAPGEIIDMARELLPKREVRDDPWEHHLYGSSDLGDLSSILPLVQFHTGGICGALHQTDFDIVDEEEAYILTSKLFALSAYRLLRNGAKLAEEYRQNFRPVFSGRREYCDYIERMHTVYEEFPE